MTPSVDRRHYMLTMRLDLACVDEAKLQVLTQPLQCLDVTVVTLRQEQASDPDAVRRAYLCHQECRTQQPPVELRREPIAFDRWRAAFLDGENAAPEQYFLASQRGQYAGVCLFETQAQEPSTLVSGFTGVLPTWTGWGIAKALKAQGLLRAKQHGFKAVETQNLIVNRGMCAINRALGFQTVRKHLHTYPIPVDLTAEQGRK